MEPRSLVVGITGASGAVYAKRLLERLAVESRPVRVHVVATDNAKTVWQHELASSLSEALGNLSHPRPWWSAHVP